MKDGSILDETPPDYMAMIEKIMAEDEPQSTARRFSPMVEAIERDYGRDYSNAPMRAIDVVDSTRIGERIAFKDADGKITCGVVSSPIRTVDGVTTFEIKAWPDSIEEQQALAEMHDRLTRVAQEEL